MNDTVDRMVADGLIDSAAAQRVRAQQAEGATLDQAIMAGAQLPEDTALRYLANALGLDYVDIESEPPAAEFLSRFPVRLLIERQLLPLAEDDGVVLTATSAPFDTTGLDELSLASGKPCQAVLATAAGIDRCLTQLLGIGADTVQSMVSDAGAGVQVLDRDDEDGVDLAQAAEDASVIKFVNQVLSEAIELRATDVHFEPFENELRVRYRIDGVLQAAAIPAEVRRFQAAIVSRMKILSRLDIAEKRLPQDGRIKLRIAGREIDVRVSVIPMLHGEAVVLRLLDRNAALLGLEQLGMSAKDRGCFDRILALPHGIVLVTGPTGSGKTTTLYAALSQINDVERKIITIEDPIEYHLRGINQIQVSTKAGLTFACGLRSILRHDPDVILVGEIRDRETAEIAVQASLTGHLVFSTLHTNDAPGAPTRLVDMGVEPYLVASSLEAVLAQRLVRIICPECRQPIASEEVARLSAEYGDGVPETLFAGAGCRACQGTGYRGRVGIFELMLVTESLRALVLQRASATDIRKAAAAQGMTSLREDGWRLLAEGRTTIDDVLRVTRDERANGRPIYADHDAGPAAAAKPGEA